jgi:hypothetical protein
MLKIILGLRDNQHQVDVLKPNGASRPVLGTSHPAEENRRLNVLKQWGVTLESPRHQALENIGIPLSQRSQTILSYQVSQAVRQSLNGAAGPLADSRRHNQKNSTEPLNAAVYKADGSE